MTDVVASRDLESWLNWQLDNHRTAIELGLERVSEVAERLGIIKPAPITLLVAGTNGKGSSAAWIRALWYHSESVGIFCSPHLWRYNERVTVDGVQASDDQICQAFEAIKTACGDDISLSYFEYSALCALWCFKQAGVDLAIMEVGLGGRLDATNIVDADAALITSIGLDHVQWLGSDREQIGYEKAGVMRADRPVIVADRQPPVSLEQRANVLRADHQTIGRDFDLTAADTGWELCLPNQRYRLAAVDGVVPENVAGAAALVSALGRTPSLEQLEATLSEPPRLPGRRQRVDGTVPLIYDVGHNLEAVAVLADQLAADSITGWTRVVVGMLDDKPIEAVAARLEPITDVFYPAGLDDYSPRGLTGHSLAGRMGVDGPCWSGPAEALAAAQNESTAGDRIVICGSFHAVSNVLAEN